MRTMVDLTSANWSRVWMPPEAEVVGGDVGDHGHVVVGHPDPQRRMPPWPSPARPAGGRAGPGPGGPARAMIALLDQLAVQVDAVGVGPADPLRGTGPCGRSGGSPSSCRWCRSPPPSAPWAQAGTGRGQVRPRPRPRTALHPLGQAAVVDPRPGHRVAERLGGVLAAPRVGDHHLGRLGTEPAAHRPAPAPRPRPPSAGPGGPAAGWRSGAAARCLAAPG